ncbi:MAG: Ig-like domain-containing protein, partial [Candidatus Saccharimonadales bacterium]
TTLHGINVFESTNVSLDSVTLKNNDGYGLVVNNSIVNANDITTENNSWGGINVDKGSPILNITGTSNQNELGAIVVEGTSSTVNFEAGKYTAIAPGVYRLTLEAPTNLLPAEGTVTNDNDFIMSWSSVPGATKYEYQTANTLSNPTTLGAIIYTDDSLSSGNYTLGTVVTRSNNNAPDNNYYWQVRAGDNFGTWSPWSVINKVTVDSTAPVVAISTPSDGDTVKGIVTISGSVTDNNPDHYYLVVKNSHGTVVAGPKTVSKADVDDWSWDTTKLADGAYIIDLEARDAANNKDSNSTKTITVTVDNTAPVGGSLTMKTKLFPSGLTVASPTDGVYTLPDLSMDGVDVFDSLSVAVTDDNLDTTTKPAVSVDGTVNGYMEYNTSTNVWDYAGQTSVPTFASGTHDLVTTFSDTAGNTTTLTARFTTDNTPPTATISYDITDWTNGSVIATLNPSELVNVTNNSGATSYTFTNNGTFTFEFSDTAGNTNTALATVSKIDKVAPTATYRHYIDGIEFTGSIAYVNNINRLSFTGEYADATPSSGLLKDSYVIFDAQTDHSFKFSQNGAKSYCSWRTEPNLVDLSGNPFSLTTKESFANCVSTLGEGEYYMAHQVYDNAIRNDIPSITQFRDVLGLHFVIDNTDPVAVLDPITSPNGGLTDSVNISGSVSDIVGVTGYEITINGVVVDSGTNTVAPPYAWDISSLASGTYTVILTATDAAGNTNSATQDVDIDNTAPVITYTDTIQDDNIFTPIFTVDGYSTFNWIESSKNPIGATFNGSLLTPVFSVMNDGTYVFTLYAYDEFKNESSYDFTFTYKAPVVAPLLTPATVAPDVVYTPPTDDGEVLGDADIKDENSPEERGDQDGEIKGESDVKEDDEQNGFLGLEWYWWLLLFAILGGGGWWFIAGWKKRKEAE